jgi:hypothetical protein
VSRPPAYPKDATERQCVGPCGQVKPADQFYRKPNGYLRSKCIKCWTLATVEYQRRPEVQERRAAEMRVWRAANPRGWMDVSLRHRHNIGVDDYERLLVEQGGGCAICGGDNGGKTFHVDHDHRCCKGQRSCGLCRRALLCGTCNRLLGQARDLPRVLRAAADYLEVHGAL